MKKLLNLTGFLIPLLFIFAHGALAASTDDYKIDPSKSKIQCSVKNSLTGKYLAAFKEFTGVITFNADDPSQGKVLLKIKTDSLKSKHPKLDRLAVSKRLLDAPQYPDISFKSQSIEKNKDGYLVKGLIRMHGVVKEMSFTFKVDGPKKDKARREYVRAHGRWIVNRKHFDVSWNKALDHGGVIVSDFITIDWEITAFHSS